LKSRSNARGYQLFRKKYMYRQNVATKLYNPSNHPDHHVASWGASTHAHNHEDRTSTRRHGAPVEDAPPRTGTVIMATSLVVSGYASVALQVVATSAAS
jgi:hypothetical protein